MKKIFFLLSFLFLLDKVKSADDFLSKFHQTDYKMNFERCVVDDYNRSYVKDIKITTFKYNRTRAVMNSTFNFLLDFGFDVQTLVQAYKLSSNEYRTFPIRYQMNFCSALEHDIAGLGKSFYAENPHCPLKKGVTYRLKNYYPDESKLPPFIPNGNFRVQVTLLYLNKNVFSISAYIVVYRPILPA